MAEEFEAVVAEMVVTPELVPRFQGGGGDQREWERDGPNFGKGDKKGGRICSWSLASRGL